MTAGTRKEFYMNDEMKMMFNAVLDEIGRMDEKSDKKFESINRRFDKIDAELESLHHEVNACKLERDSVGFLIKRLDKLEESMNCTA